MADSKEMVSQLDLIHEVQIRPGLWDPSQPMDSADKLEQWKEIGAALFKDWRSLNKANAYDRVIQLQKKWRSLKDGYSRDIRLRKRGQRRKTYVYFKNLTFLGGFEGLPDPPEDPPVYLPVIKRSPDSTDDDDIIQDDDRADHIKDPLTEPKPPKKNKPKRKPEKRRTKRRYRDVHYNENEPEKVEITVDSSDSDDDSDKQFLVSFVPEIKKLPPNIKMWVRAQIANIMQEAVACHLSNTTPMKPYDDAGC